LRASTPTAAAEKATPVRFELIEKIKNLQLRLNTKVNSQIQSKKENFEYLNKFLKSPSSIVNNYKEKLLDDFKNLTLSIENKFSISKLSLINLGKSVISPDSLVSLTQTKINNLSKNLNLNIANNYKDNLEKYKANIRLLNSNSISSNLKKGYSILMNKKKIVKTTKIITTNDQLSVKLIDGTIDIKVKKIN
jgi:exodeoxyribonuclease VII large subunit